MDIVFHVVENPTLEENHPLKGWFVQCKYEPPNIIVHVSDRQNGTYGKKAIQYDYQSYYFGPYPHMGEAIKQAEQLSIYLPVALHRALFEVVRPTKAESELRASTSKVLNVEGRPFSDLLFGLHVATGLNDSVINRLLLKYEEAGADWSNLTISELLEVLTVKTPFDHTLY